MFRQEFTNFRDVVFILYTENPYLGLEMERRKNKKKFCGVRMEDHERQSAKNLAGERKYFAARNEFMALSMCLDANQYSNTDIRQLLKT